MAEEEEGRAVNMCCIFSSRNKKHSPHLGQMKLFFIPGPENMVLIFGY